MGFPLKSRLKAPKFRKEYTFGQKCRMSVIILLLCAVFQAIPTPGTNTAYFEAMIGSSAAMNLINSFTGGGLSRVSVTMLGITPYITASIIVQLLAVIFPKIKEMQKEKSQKDKVEKATFAAGVILALSQSGTMAILYGRQGLLIDDTWYWVLLVTAIWTIGSTGLAFAGRLIQKRYFGNGVSLVLLLSILSSYPSDAWTLLNVLVLGRKPVFMVLAVAIILTALFLLFAFTTFIQLCEKKIPVIYSGKISAGQQYSRQNYIPIKLCPGGVVPIIFASSLLSFPVMIGHMFEDVQGGIWGFLDSGQWFDMAHPYYTAGALLYAAMIFGFSYFYTGMVFSPYEVAENIKKSGGMITGIRPGSPTVDYLKRQLKYLVAIGAATLTVIAFIPLILTDTMGIPSLSFLGTSIIITVGVILDTRDKYKAEAAGEKFITNRKHGGIFHAKKNQG